MNSARSYVRYLLVGVIVVFALGLAIGYSQGDDPTFLNSVSKVLLTVGFLGVIVIGAVLLITRCEPQAADRELVRAPHQDGGGIRRRRHGRHARRVGQ